ncbi:uncharacterized protein TM35_000332300 [Trypanosoma theileri]|uniref:Uncharacterized protein n=1 Tax=Trypanosoma theileri TaxID=67003 RepID=A0A1X0NMQ5_9TRYP|nr:uncharacterized protein TM35_000332300 [Trypanosoma theileri]ORC85773.1 hypothetical protein TM35_000332300 [Trypanosoma theileri]
MSRILAPGRPSTVLLPVLLRKAIVPFEPVAPPPLHYEQGASIAENRPMPRHNLGKGSPAWEKLFPACGRQLVGRYPPQIIHYSFKSAIHSSGLTPPFLAGSRGPCVPLKSQF